MATKMSSTEIARRLGVAVDTVDSWRTGRRVPAARRRVELAEWLSIGEVTWDQPANQAPETIAPLPERLAVATPGLVESQADYLLSELQRLQRHLRDTPDEAVSARLDHLSACAKVTLALGKMTGVGLTVSMRRILASPDWLRLEELIKQALRPHPDAARAVAAALTQAGL